VVEKGFIADTPNLSRQRQAPTSLPGGHVGWPRISHEQWPPDRHSRRRRRRHFVVFELKRGEAPDKAIGQIASYMGWVSLNLAYGKAVSGVIVARSIKESLREAIAVVPNVSLFEYRLRLELNAIGRPGLPCPRNPPPRPLAEHDFSRLLALNTRF